MSEFHVVSALVQKRSEISGQIGELEKQINRHQADLVHIDAVLRMYGKADPEAIRVKDISRRSDWFRPGECRNLIYDVLRHPEAPVPTRTIAEPFMLAKDYRPERHAGGGADQAKRVGGTREDGVS